MATIKKEEEEEKEETWKEEHRNPHDATKTTDSNSDKKEDSSSPFVTTSDILHHLNKALAEVNAPTTLDVGSLKVEEEEDDNGENKNTQQQQQPKQKPEQTAASATNLAATTTATPYFELQRRLPDGSTRRATESEHKAADLESKLQQVAAHISTLPPDQQWAWILQQKAYGNQLYATGDRYEEAIDVYLTVVMMAQNLQAKEGEKSTTQSTNGDSNNNNNHDNSSSKNNSNNAKESSSPVATREEHELVFLHCMNNLAQCALQLSWYSKAIQFTQLALDKQQKEIEEASSNAATENAQLLFQWGKLYYKRGKAHRLRGEYDEARQNLDHASQWLDQTKERAEACGDSDLQTQLGTARTAIAKERSLVKQGEAAAQKNEQRQQQALKNAFASSSGASASTKKTRFDAAEGVDCSGQEGRAASGQRRTYSSIQAPSSSSSYSPRHANKDDDDDDDDDEDSVSTPYQLSYWEYYLAVLGRIAEELLVWMGDEEFVERRKVMQQLQQRHHGKRD